MTFNTMQHNQVCLRFLLAANIQTSNKDTELSNDAAALHLLRLTLENTWIPKPSSMSQTHHITDANNKAHNKARRYMVIEFPPCYLIVCLDLLFIIVKLVFYGNILNLRVQVEQAFSLCSRIKDEIWAAEVRGVATETNSTRTEKPNIILHSVPFYKCFCRNSTFTMDAANSRLNMAL